MINKTKPQQILTIYAKRTNYAVISILTLVLLSFIVKSASPINLEPIFSIIFALIFIYTSLNALYYVSNATKIDTKYLYASKSNYTLINLHLIIGATIYQCLVNGYLLTSILGLTTSVLLLLAYLISNKEYKQRNSN